MIVKKERVIRNDYHRLVTSRQNEKTLDLTTGKPGHPVSLSDVSERSPKGRCPKFGRSIFWQSALTMAISLPLPITSTASDGAETNFQSQTLKRQPGKPLSIKSGDKYMGTCRK